MSVYVLCVCVFNHSYVVCGFGCSRNVFCSVVSVVGIWCVTLSYGVYIYVSFSVG